MFLDECIQGSKKKAYHGHYHTRKPVLWEFIAAASFKLGYLAHL